MLHPGEQLAEPAHEVVLQLERARWDAVLSGDLDRLHELLADELTYTHADGRVDSKTSYLAGLAGGAVRYTSVDRDDAHVAAVGTTVVVSGPMLVGVEVENQPVRSRLQYTAVWARVDGRWRFASWHSSFLR